MRGYFTSRFVQSCRNNVLQPRCEPGILHFRSRIQNKLF